MNVDTGLEWLIGRVPYSEQDLPVLRTLDEIAALEAGWRFGEGAAPLPAAVAAARRLYRRALAMGHAAGDASPLADGGVAMDIYAPPVHIELYFRAGGAMDYTILKDDSEVLADRAHLDWDAAGQALEEFGALAWKSCVYSTGASTGRGSADSILALSRIRPGAASPSSAPIARFVLANPVVNMLADSTRGLPAIRRFSGLSMPPRFPPAPASSKT